MTQKLTPEQTKSLLDSLFALPDKVKKESTPKKPKQSGEPSINKIATAVNRNPAFKPVQSIIEVVHQECTTCGTTHQYVRSRLVRFEQTNPNGNLRTAYEVETVVPENLPRRVDHTYTDTNVCPTCLTLSRDFEDFLAVAERPIQKELFHG